MGSCLCEKAGVSLHLGAADPVPLPAPTATTASTAPPTLSAPKFQEQTDDGTNPELWHQAELILVGLSGMSKTPISKALAQDGIYVSNYPLVKGVAVPEALSAIPAHKVLALSIRADVLWSIRQDRAYRWGMSSSDLFVDFEEIEEEVRWVKRIYRQHGWRIVNVTDRQPPDVAKDIMQKVLARS